MNITTTPFGRFWNAEVTCYKLENSSGVSLSILDYGAIIQSLRAPGRDGGADIILGFDSLYDYLKGHPFFGAVAGRVANRIPDGRFSIDGKDYQLGVNAPFGNHLHGGFRGFDKYVWESEAFYDGDSAGVRLHRVSPDGEEGYPGNLDTVVTYRLTNDNVVEFDVDAETDRPTIVNIVQHAYFNMAGHASGDVRPQELSIAAEAITPTDDRLCPTGEILAVAGTPFDFLEPHGLGAAFDANGGVCDVNYVLKSARAGLKACARLHDPGSGRTLAMATDQPGLQFYNGHKIHEQNQVGKGGHRYSRWAGICLETQAFPNAVNHDHFPSMVIRPGERYRHETRYAFSVE
ncbi:MAG: galactose mutarotase [Desulfofustis sp.]